MNLILLFPEDFIDGGNRVCLGGRRRRHVREVHRAAIGDELRVGRVNGLVGTGRIVRSDDAVIEMEANLSHEPPAPLPLVLVLALPRPKVLRRVLRAVSSLGVKRIVLLHANRVEKSYWQTPFLSPGSIQEQLVLGLEQARDTVLPEVQLRQQFKPFVEDELPGIMAGTIALAAHPDGGEPCPRNISGPATLVIGPEGGFLPYEIEKLAATGVKPVTIGNRILSVETAVPALIARLF